MAFLRGFAIDAIAPTPSASAASSDSCWSSISCVSTTLEWKVKAEKEDEYTLQDEESKFPKHDFNKQNPRIGKLVKYSRKVCDKKTL